MAIFVKQQNERTELQKRIAAELAEKAKNKAAAGEGDLPDGVEDSAFIENQRQTTKRAWLWILLATLTVALISWLVVATR